MIVTNEIDYEWDIDNQFACAGFPARNKRALQQMEPGDKIIYYVTKHSKFMAITEVVGDIFIQNNLFGMIHTICGHIEYIQNPLYLQKIMEREFS